MQQTFDDLQNNHLKLIDHDQIHHPDPDLAVASYLH